MGQVVFAAYLTKCAEGPDYRYQVAGMRHASLPGVESAELLFGEASKGPQNGQDDDLKVDATGTLVSIDDGGLGTRCTRRTEGEWLLVKQSLRI